MISAKVYIVGAGPGHPELLTLKAAELLRSADVVIYDRLVQEEVLGLAKPSAERLYMGKPLGKHDSRQDEIHELMLRKYKEGKSVVRLKGGDPFLFGRGGEEAEYLAEHDVPFEVIPGVSSSLAAPLCAGIAVTHRDASSCVTIATGHEAKEGESRLDWAALARMETVVFLMGVKNAGNIAARLMEHGRSPETPVAAIQMAFWHDENVAVGTLGTIVQEMERAGIKPPATLVVGEVVRLRERIGGSHRELKRRADGSSRFEPAPPPDQLIRIALAGMGTQALGFALEQGVFDRIEAFTAPADLAAALGLDAWALQDVMDALVSLGLIEESAGTYRNLDMASRYLRSDAPQSLRPALLQYARESAPWGTLEEYVRTGCRDSLPPATASGQDLVQEETCEALARFAAPAVTDKLDLGARNPVRLLGWGGQAYASAISARWPHLEFSSHNPFAVLRLKPGNPFRVEGRAGAKSGSCGAVILSGLLASCSRGEVQMALESVAAVLAPGGLVVLHDAFLPISVLPPVEVALGTLARHVTRGGCRTWSVPRLKDALGALGFVSVTSEALPAGTVLVTAQKG